MNKQIASKLTKAYDMPERYFGLTKKQAGSNEHIFRRLITNIIVGGTLEDNAISATLAIFKKYKNGKALSKASVWELTLILNANKIRFAGRKAGYILSTAEEIQKKHKGIVPNNRKDLEAFSGVGRHVASIVLALGYDKNEFAVDLHVKRIAKRLGLVNENDSDKIIEDKLSKGIKPELLGRYSRAFVDFGKTVCASKPDCANCFLVKTCKQVAPTKAPKQKASKSKSSKGDGVYEIIAGSSALPYSVTVKNGTASCNCKGYRFRRTCSHITAV